MGDTRLPEPWCWDYGSLDISSRRVKGLTKSFDISAQRLRRNRMPHQTRAPTPSIPILLAWWQSNR
jgi:hypothetical protein